MNVVSLKKQALERWNTLPRSEQQKLLTELQPGQTIELDEPERAWPESVYRSKARIVSIVFGVDLTKNSKRYLFKSEIPQ